MNEQAMLLPWIKRSKRILLVTGDEFTADGSCAMLTLQMLLMQMGKEVVAVKPTRISEKLSFLKGQDLVKQNLEKDGQLVISIPEGSSVIDKVNYTIEENATNIVIYPKKGQLNEQGITFAQTAGQFDLIITLETISLEALDQVFAENTVLFTQTPVINIASNISNEFFGKLNLVDPTKASTCEILFDWISGENELLSSLNSELATTLLTGIISATESFLEPSTSASSLEIAGKLQEIGARHSDIIEHLFKMKTLPMLKIWGEILGRIKLDSVNKIAWGTLYEHDFKMTKASTSDVGEISENLLRHINGADLIVLFLEKDEEVVLQIRVSDRAGITANALLEAFGGDVVLHGVNVKILKNAFSSTESDVLAKLSNIQKHYLQPGFIESNLKSIAEMKSADNVAVGKSEPALKNTVPKIPEDVPFSVEK